MFTTPAAGNSWSQHSLQPCLLPTWDKISAAALSDYADPLLLATWVQIFLSHRNCLTQWGYSSTGVKQLDQLRMLREQGTPQPWARWGYHNHQTPYKEALSDNVIVWAKNISFWSFGTSKQVFYLLSESGLWLQLWTSHLFSLVTHAQMSLIWPPCFKHMVQLHINWLPKCFSWMGILRTAFYSVLLFPTQIQFSLPVMA